jgi:hypothetical protein
MQAGWHGASLLGKWDVGESREPAIGSKVNMVAAATGIIMRVGVLRR